MTHTYANYVCLGFMHEYPSGHHSESSRYPKTFVFSYIQSHQFSSREWWYPLPERLDLQAHRERERGREKGNIKY